MNRSDAIEVLVSGDLAQLGPAERENLLLDWWSIDRGDFGYDSLPSRLKEVLLAEDGPQDPTINLYDPLLYLALKRSYVGVVNNYLESRMAALGRPEPVIGEVERLAACPCCGYRSLGECGGYEICRVCFWEDDGTIEIDQISGPNRMTLRDARRNFRHFGAVDQESRQHVLADGKERYAFGGG